MARFFAEIPTPYTEEQIQGVIAQFCQAEGFTPVIFQGEEVLKKGDGLMVAPQFIKVMYSPGMVRLEAWLKYALLPGVFVGEMGLTGFFGIALKKVLQGRVDTLISCINAAAPETAQEAPHAAPQ